MKPTVIEVAALLRCRHAGRYDNFGKKTHKPPTRAEAAAEQSVWSVDIPSSTFADLAARGLIQRERGVYRLTAAGHAALEPNTRKGEA